MAEQVGFAGLFVGGGQALLQLVQKCCFVRIRGGGGELHVCFEALEIEPGDERATAYLETLGDLKASSTSSMHELIEVLGPSAIYELLLDDPDGVTNLAGLTLHHAYVVLDVDDLSARAVSNAVPCALVP